MFIYALVHGSPIACINVAALRQSGCGTAELFWKLFQYSDSGLQLICIVGSRVFHLPLDNTLSIPYGVKVKQLYRPMKHSHLIVIKSGISNFISVGRFQVLLDE